MANKPRGFRVTAGRRPSGTPYWTVRGMQDGRQLRREFNERSEAFAFAEQQNSETNGVAADVSLLSTRLQAGELREAETALAQMRRDLPGVSLLDLLEFYKTHSGALSLDEVRRVGPALRLLKAKYPELDLGTASCCNFAKIRSHTPFLLHRFMRV